MDYLELIERNLTTPQRTKTVDDITTEQVQCIYDFLEEEGREYFLNIYKSDGEMTAVHILGGGMQVRNKLRSEGLADGWSAHDMDDLWQAIVRKAIGVEEWPTTKSQTIIERIRTLLTNPLNMKSLMRKLF